MPVRRIETERLILEPVTPDIARAVVAGDFSSLDAAEGWPHDDTTDAMAMMTGSEAGPGWLITTGGSVIGDCGAYAWPDRTGEVQIGYGLAAPSRGHGYATEAASAMCSWLFTDAGATRITAVDVLSDNLPSRRVLEKVGFTVTDESHDHLSYALAPYDIRSRR